MAECRVCGAKVVLEAGTVEGELLECQDCGCELAVLALDPPMLDEVPEMEEDWGE